ncbi:MAG: SLC13 family permease [Bacteroidaceae bacterium]|nr:SLC13 family permease [Prevotellaceae bacterium]MDY5632374.1 SLC13 family permease [Bacteroidaceae bacterium]
MVITLIVLVLSVAGFIWGRVRSDIVALAALVTLILAGVLTPQEALSGFSSSVVIMMVALFVVGGAVLQTGLAKALSQRLMRLAGGSETKAFLLVMLVTSGIGAFVSNTGTVALMMPIIISMAAQAGTHPGRLLMPLAFASSLGGMLTLIGTPPNLVIQETLTQAGYEPLRFFSFLPVGLISISVGIVVLLPLSRLLVRKGTGKNKKERVKSPDELAEEYALFAGMTRLRIGSKSPLVGQTVAQASLGERYGVSILEVREGETKRNSLWKQVRQSLPAATKVFAPGEILYLTGEDDSVARLAHDFRLRKLDGHVTGFYDIGITELVVMPSSRLDGLRVSESAMRERHGVSILGIKRDGGYLKNGLAQERLHAGDVLLVQGQWDSISALAAEHEDWVLLSRPEEQAQRVTLTYKAPLAAFILFCMVLVMVFDFIPIAPVTAIMLAGLLMVLGGCFRDVEAAYRTINWSSVVLIAAMMPMSLALEKTGVSSWVSESLVRILGGAGPIALLAGIYFTTSLLTMFISNTATAVLMAPIALAAAQGTGASPYPFLFAVTLGASMCFASPFSTPPNALVMRAGEYRFSDYVRVGLPLQIVMGIVMTLVLPLLFPF